MTKSGVAGENELSCWPIQMRLVRTWAPYLKGASLLVAGDCTAFAYPAIQKEVNEVRDITVLHMTVPCCSQSHVVGIDVKLIAERPNPE